MATIKEHVSSELERLERAIHDAFVMQSVKSVEGMLGLRKVKEKERYVALLLSKATKGWLRSGKLGTW
jgi:hypothetical protein